MTGLPAHPDTGGNSDAGPDAVVPGSSRPAWVAGAGVVIVLGVVALMVVLHLLGVFGPGSH